MKEAILLVNMGGPGRRNDVQPYLRSIFRDRAILDLPSIVREPLASLIAMRRHHEVEERYELIGGYTPLYHWSGRLRAEIEHILRGEGDDTLVAYGFRYSSPTIEEALRDLQRKGAEFVRLVPLFPHYTHTMTGSCVKEACRIAEKLNLEIAWISGWELEPDILDLWSEYIAEALIKSSHACHVLFVAHGIPQVYVNRGDAYPKHVESSARALGERLPRDVTWTLAYQSRVGPVKWTEPYMENEIPRLAHLGDTIVVVPLSFAADCLETLYDLEIVARDLASRHGAKALIRTRVFNDDPKFARAMVRLSREVSHDAILQ